MQLQWMWIAAVAFPLRVLAQQTAHPAPVLVPLEAGSCRMCTLALEYVTTVGSASDAELIRDRHSLMALRQGGFVAWGDGLLQRYDQNGRYVGKVGVLGDGPGEYRGEQALANARGDSVTVFSYSKLTTVSTVTGRGRTAQSPVQTRAFRLLVMPDGSSVVQNYAEGHPAFVIMAPGGEVLREFGPMAPVVELTPGGRKVSDYDAQQFVLAASPSGGFWAASINYRHLLQRWTLSGTAAVTIDRHPRWFLPYDFATRQERSRLGAGLAPPVANTVATWVDQSGDLFVLNRTADIDWKKDPNAVAPPVPGESAPRKPWVPTGGIDRYVDGVVEIYNDKSGAFLGSWRSDGFVGWPGETGLVAKKEQDKDGVITFTIWRFAFRAN